MRTVIVIVVALVALVTAAADPVGAEGVAPAAVVEQHVETLHPSSTRRCSFGTCTHYFNKRETQRIADSLSAATFLCSIVPSGPGKLICGGAAWLLSRVADTAVAHNRCVLFRQSRWVFIITSVETYGPSWRCS